MKDAENLTKLVGRADPKWLREVMRLEREIDLPKVPVKSGKRQVRDQFRDALMRLSVSQRKEWDKWAERINLLTDIVGKEAVAAVREENLNTNQREALDAIGNEYDRSLWLYANARDSFREALDIRQVKWLSQRKRCHSGFCAPKNLRPKEDGQHLDALHQTISSFLGRPVDQVAIEMFERPDAEGDVSLYLVSIHRNRPPEVVEYVRESKVENGSITRAESLFVTYEPNSGSIYVLSKYTVDRGHLAKLVADSLFQTELSGETIPVKRIEYQCLARPFVFKTYGKPVVWVKVTLLGFTVGNRTMEYRIGVRNPGDVYELVRRDIGHEFRFDKHHITAARITVRVGQQPGEGEHSVNIELRGESSYSTKSERESDRALCDWLLEKWEILRDVEDDLPAAANIR